jgi:16S rRNA G966 N2-methylase RsmD
MEKLLDPKVQSFIQDHLNDDPVSLLLKSDRFPGIPLKEAVIQIKARQNLKQKLPEWVADKNIIFPPALSQEQSSSQKAAEYKASLISGKQLLDLTGGAGVDTYYLSKSFTEVTYVEPNQDLFEISRHNLTYLGASNINFFKGKAEEFLLTFAGKADWIYVDPDRRSGQQKKLFLLSDCEPDVIKLLPQLLEAGRKILIKTSPLLDISQAIDGLKYVKNVHVVAVNNEVKEVLYLLDEEKPTEITITTSNLLDQNNSQLFTFFNSQEQMAEVNFTLPLNYLYEPNAAILKAGAFNP